MLPPTSIAHRDEPLKVVLVSLDGPPIEDRMVTTLAEHGVDLVIDECDSPEQVVSVAKDAGAGSVSLEELLQSSDFISIHTPLTDDSVS